MTRGDVVVSSQPGDYGKPRPAVIVQSDLFNPTHASVVICPITTHLVDAPLFRLDLPPSTGSGIRKESQIMIDKIMAVKRERIGKRIGRLDTSQMSAIDLALCLWLNIEMA